MKDVGTFSSKLQLALEQVGTDKGVKSLAPEPSQDSADADMHEYFVAKTGEAVFKRRAERALARLTGGAVSDAVAEVVARTRKNDLKESATLITGQHYALTLETKKPARKTSTEKIAAKLITKHKFTRAQVLELFAECEDVMEPSKTFRASPVVE